MTKKRACRLSETGRDRSRRNGRAGAAAHRSGNYVRRMAPAEAEPAPHQTQKPVTVPRVKFLERSQIAGEWV